MYTHPHIILTIPLGNTASTQRQYDIVDHMEPSLNIQEMADITGLSAHTLRYYERIGLLRHVARNAQGYRIYSTQDVAWVEFLLRLRDTGMNIAGMQRFAELRSQGDVTASERRQMLEQHETQLRQQLASLQDHLHNISDKIQYYRQLEQQTTQQS